LCRQKLKPATTIKMPAAIIAALLVAEPKLL